MIRQFPPHPDLSVRLQQEAAPVLLQGNKISREDYPHIDTRRTLLSLCYLPLIHTENLIGTLEILSFEEAITEDAIQALLPAATVAGQCD